MAGDAVYRDLFPTARENLRRRMTPEGDFARFLTDWFLEEIRLMERQPGQRTALRAAVAQAWNPWTPTAIEGTRHVALHVDLLFKDLGTFRDAGAFELYPWVPPAYAAMILEGVHEGGLAYWLCAGGGTGDGTVAPDVAAVIGGSVVATVAMLGWPCPGGARADTAAGA